jgi:hypothetical protein
MQAVPGVTGGARGGLPPSAFQTVHGVPDGALQQRAAQQLAGGHFVVARELAPLPFHPIDEIVEQRRDVLAARGHALIGRGPVGGGQASLIRRCLGRYPVWSKIESVEIIEICASSV